MTDKFVVGSNEIGEIIVTDVETDRVYRYDDISNFFGLIRLLNEQQATIQSLKEENEQLRKELSECEKFRYSVFKGMEKTLEKIERGMSDE